ncbi:MAG: PQQ-binding-like beta-propeller repeat protein [Planctomycetota bacterium]|nr:PQQ-binding-like beta-propeller repeat protein [Planctomycetota bacterium]
MGKPVCCLIVSVFCALILVAQARVSADYDKAQWERVKTAFWRDYEGKDSGARVAAVRSLGFQNHIEAAKLLVKLLDFRDTRTARIERERAKLEQQYAGLLTRFEREARRGKGQIDSSLAEEVAEMEMRLRIVDDELNSLLGVRYVAIDALQAFTDSESVQWMCGTLATDKNIRIRTGIAEALGGVNCKSIDIGATLLATSVDKDPRVRSVSIDSLDRRVPGRLILPCVGGHLRCASGVDGETLWAQDFDQLITGPVLVDDVTLDGRADVVVALADKCVHAIGIEDGKKIWSSQPADSSNQTLAVLQTGGEAGALVIAAAPSKGLVAYSGASGSLVWKHEANGALLHPDGIGDLNNDGFPDIAFCTNDKKIVALDGKTQARLWEEAVAGEFRAAPVRIDIEGDGKFEVVAVTHEGTFVALAGANGKKVWDFAFWKAGENQPADGKEKDEVLFLQPVQLTRRGSFDLLGVTRRGKIVLLAAREITAKWTATLSYESPLLPPLIADINRDGIFDVYIGFEAAAGVWLNGETGKQLRDEQKPKVKVAATLADANRDGRLDFVEGTGEKKVTIRRDLGDSDLRPVTVNAELLFPAAASEIAVGSADIEKVLVAALADKHWQVRASAARALGRQGCRSAVQPLIEALAKEQGRLRGDIDSALKNITGVSFGGSSEGWLNWWAENAEGWQSGFIGRARAEATGRAAAATTFYTIETLSKNLIFVLDISGSMAEPTSVHASGTGADADKPMRKIDVAKTELKKAIKLLPEDARFGIIVYSSSVFALTPGMLDAKPDIKAKTYKAVDDLEPTAQTNIFGGLERAFAMCASGKSLVDQVYELGADTIFFMTDGLPTAGRFIDPTSILAEVARWNVERKLTIHAIGVGEHDKSFMRRLAENNGGQYVSK